MRWAAFFALSVLLVIAGLAGAVLLGFGCDENLRAGTARGDVCTTVGEVGSVGWWSLVFAPALLFFAIALHSGRRSVAVLAGALFAALVVVDTVLLAIATSNLLE
jgi:hypothetical protein